jgi:hypothetical protein
MTITSHRILYLDPKNPKSTGLENVTNLEKVVSIFNL